MTPLRHTSAQAPSTGPLTRRRPRHDVRVVTDSTASLPPDLAAQVDVVPLTVVLDGQSRREGEDVTPEEIASALVSGARVSTSQPPRAAFEDAYARAADDGAREVVSVHLSGELSGTVQQAAAAAATAPLPVRVVDARTAGMALGFAVAQAAVLAAQHRPGDEVARRAVRVAASSRAIFMVDSLEHLRRGGRLSAPAAALGSVLGVRPLLRMRGGKIEVVQRVRTRSAAVDRLVGVAVESAERRAAPLLAVHHVGAPDLAEQTARELEEQTGRSVVVTPLSAVLAAHVGPGTLAIVIAEGA